MRVKIVTAMHGKIDGIDLERFEVGRVYEVGTSLGQLPNGVGIRDASRRRKTRAHHATGRREDQF
jgi:hypothetical protein